MVLDVSAFTARFRAWAPLSLWAVAGSCGGAVPGTGQAGLVFGGGSVWCVNETCQGREVGGVAWSLESPVRNIVVVSRGAYRGSVQKKGGGPYIIK